MKIKPQKDGNQIVFIQNSEVFRTKEIRVLRELDFHFDCIFEENKDEQIFVNKMLINKDVVLNLLNNPDVNVEEWTPKRPSL